MNKHSVDKIREQLAPNYFEIRSFQKLKVIGLQYLDEIAENFKGDNTQEFNQWICNEGNKFSHLDKQGMLAQTVFVAYLISLRLERIENETQ